jgi:micrococcal nuclease
MILLCLAIPLFFFTLPKNINNNFNSTVVKNTPQIITKPIATTSPQTLYEVVQVVDGDTIKVNIQNELVTLRLIGIDTPETKDPRKPVQCFGEEASKKATELLQGKKIYLEADPTQGELDKYNRLLRYVFFEDHTSYQEKMIKEGYGFEYTYNLPYKYQKEYKEAEVFAREHSLGLWNNKTCSGKTGRHN